MSKGIKFGTPKTFASLKHIMMKPQRNSYRCKSGSEQSAGSKRSDTRHSKWVQQRDVKQLSRVVLQGNRKKTVELNIVSQTKLSSICYRFFLKIKTCQHIPCLKNKCEENIPVSGQ
jgi:hypothetical protein